MKWIEALKVYNAGKMWCVPRKGTPEYDEVKKIMNRTKPAEVEKRNVERREKATEQLKALDTRKKIEERREKEKAVAILRDTKQREVIDRIAEITAQIEEEKKKGLVSFEYDLGWKPQSKESLTSGGNRVVRSTYEDFVDSKDTMIDVAKVNAKIKEHETESERLRREMNKLPPKEQVYANKEYADMLIRRNDVNSKIERLRGILTNIQIWKPVNAYYGSSYGYNTKKRNTEGYDELVRKALDDYQEFADQVNKRRLNPIRTISVRHRINADGSRTLQASWDISRDGYEYPKFVRQYEILPVFKFKEGTTLASIDEEERKEKEKEETKEEARRKKKEEKEAREKDPINIIKKKIEELETEYNMRQRKQDEEVLKKYGEWSQRFKLPIQVQKQREIDIETFYNNVYKKYEEQKRELEEEIKKIQRERRKQQKK